MADKPASKKMAAAAAAPKAAPKATPAKPVASPTPTPTTAAAPMAAPAPPPPLRATPPKPRIDAAERHRLIQEAAYYRSIAPGATDDPTTHWLEAEREVERRLSGR